VGGVCVVGGHINPAVTLAMAAVGRLKWIKVPVYWLAQYIGAFIGAVCVYLVYFGPLVICYYFIFVRIPSFCLIDMMSTRTCRKSINQSINQSINLFVNITSAQHSR